MCFCTHAICDVNIVSRINSQKTQSQSVTNWDFLGKSVNIAFNICDMSEANQILISSDAWMTARTEINVNSIGLKKLKSGQEVEILECK